jgi:bacterioferritin-associated ferredoxin
MYVCLCNAITDGQVRSAAQSGASRPSAVFATCGCGAQCATCTRTILAILREDAVATSTTAAR